MPLAIAMILGLTVIGLCQWFSTYEPVQHLHFFNLFGLENSRWSVGRRELVHLIGFVGCVLFGWSLTRLLMLRSMRIAYAITGGMSIGLIWVFSGAPEIASTWFWSNRIMLVVGLEAHVTLVVLGLIGYRITPLLAAEKPALWTATIVSLGISLMWELIVQPIFGLNRAPWRSGLDAAQILCDVIGIACGYFVTKGYQSWLGNEPRKVSTPASAVSS